MEGYANIIKKWALEVLDYGVQTESQLSISNEAKPHILEYIVMRMEGMDDQRLQSELDVY